LAIAGATRTAASTIVIMVFMTRSSSTSAWSRDQRISAAEVSPIVAGRRQTVATPRSGPARMRLALPPRTSHDVPATPRQMSAIWEVPRASAAPALSRSAGELSLGTRALEECGKPTSQPALGSPCQLRIGFRQLEIALGRGIMLRTELIAHRGFCQRDAFLRLPAILHRSSAMIRHSHASIPPLQI
jgi:hypothetical protein